MKDRITTAMESQIEIVKCQHKIAKLDLEQNMLSAAHYFVSATLIVLAIIFLWL